MIPAKSKETWHLSLLRYNNNNNSNNYYVTLCTGHSAYINTFNSRHTTVRQWVRFCALGIQRAEPTIKRDPLPPAGCFSCHVLANTMSRTLLFSKWAFLFQSPCPSFPTIYWVKEDTGGR